MADAWDLFRISKEKSVALEAQTEKIRQECAKTHGKEYLVECAECYPKLLTAIESRYLHPSDEEWFFGRKRFLDEVHVLFNRARLYEIHPDQVEARIQAERHKWMRENLKHYVEIVEDPWTKDALHDRLNDKDMPLEDLAVDIDVAIGGDDPATEEDLMALEDRLVSTVDPEERTALFIEAFFRDRSGNSVADKYPKYIEMIRAGKSMSQVMEQISTDKRTAQTSKAQKKDLEERLDFFRRAKTAHGVKKAKKAAAKEAKASRVRNRERDRDKKRGQAVVPPELYRQPPCHVCGGPVRLTDGVRCCMVCQLLASWKVQESTVYCSTQCFHNPRAGHKAHSVVHTCAAGSNCDSLQDEDVDMDRQRSLVFCRECVDSLKLPTVYCSLHCYEAHFQQHRETVHLPGRAKIHAERDDATELVFENIEKTRYHARDVRGGVKSWYEAVTGWEGYFHVELGIV